MVQSSQIFAEVWECKIQEATDKYHRFIAVDQVVIDIEIQQVDLRVARTMGTSEQVNWIFANRDFLGRPDSVSVKTADDGYLGIAILGSYPHFFRMTKTGELSWAFMHPDGTLDSFKWVCSK